jgi:hypothetical protein
MVFPTNVEQILNHDDTTSTTLVENKSLVVSVVSSWLNLVWLGLQPTAQDAQVSAQCGQILLCIAVAQVFDVE